MRSLNGFILYGMHFLTRGYKAVECLADLRYFYEPPKTTLCHSRVFSRDLIRTRCEKSKFLFRRPLACRFVNFLSEVFLFIFRFNLLRAPTSDEEMRFLMHFYFRRFQRAKQCMKWMWKMQFRCIIKQFTYLNSFFGIPLFPFRCTGFLFASPSCLID